MVLVRAFQNWQSEFLSLAAKVVGTITYASTGPQSPSRSCGSFGNGAQLIPTREVSGSPWEGILGLKARAVRQWDAVEEYRRSLARITFVRQSRSGPG